MATLAPARPEVKPTTAYPAYPALRAYAALCEGETQRHWLATADRLEGRVTQRDPSRADLAWFAGFSLGLEFERPAAPPEGYDEEERRSFEDGQAAASKENDERDAARALAHADAVEMSGLPCWHADAYAMA